MTSLWRILPHDRQVSHPNARTVPPVHTLNKALFHDDSSRFLSLLLLLLLPHSGSSSSSSVSVLASLAFVF